jgi:hypothetical protein
MKIAVYLIEGYECGVAYGTYDTMEKAQEVATFLRELGNTVIIEIKGE